MTKLNCKSREEYSDPYLPNHRGTTAHQSEPIRKEGFGRSVMSQLPTTTTKTDQE